MKKLTTAILSEVFEMIDALGVNSPAINRLRNTFIAGKDGVDFTDRLKIAVRSLGKAKPPAASEAGNSSVISGDGNTGIQDVSGGSRINIGRTEKPGKKAKQILFLAASPDDEVRVSCQKEFRKVRDKIWEGKNRDDFEFRLPELAVTSDNFCRALLEIEPQIVHFSGHGLPEGIVISSEDNLSESIDNEELATNFSLIKKPELVFLNSCYSEVQARLISKEGILVIGNSFAVKDGLAVKFAQRFYLVLSTGKPYEAAFKAARVLVSADRKNKVAVWQNGQKLDW